jgi:hypothetical protein
LDFWYENKPSGNHDGTNEQQGCQRVYFHTENPNLEGLTIQNVGKVYGRLEYFTSIWYVPVLVCCSLKKLATLTKNRRRQCFGQKKTTQIDLLSYVNI